LVLIDESVDPVKLAKGSTPYFVVAMVLFRDLDQAERASAAISKARESLRVKPEFKFNKSSGAARDAFFAAVRPFDFGVRALVVKKSTIYSANLRSHTDRSAAATRLRQDPQFEIHRFTPGQSGAVSGHGGGCNCPFLLGGR